MRRSRLWELHVGSDGLGDYFFEMRFRLGTFAGAPAWDGDVFAALRVAGFALLAFRGNAAAAEKARVSQGW